MSTILALTDTLTALSAAAADLPSPSAEQPPGTGALNTILNWTQWVALAICILGLIVAGALMAIQSRRGEGGEHMGRIGMALGGVVIISAAASLVSFLVK